MIPVFIGCLITGFFAGIIYASIKNKPYKTEIKNSNIVSYKKGLGIGNDQMLFSGYRPRVWDFYILKPGKKAERVTTDEMLTKI